MIMSQFCQMFEIPCHASKKKSRPLCLLPHLTGNIKSFSQYSLYHEKEYPCLNLKIFRSTAVRAFGEIFTIYHRTADHPNLLSLIGWKKCRWLSKFRLTSCMLVCRWYKRNWCGLCFSLKFAKYKIWHRYSHVLNKHAGTIRNFTGC